METCVVITLKIDTVILKFFMINYSQYFLKIDIRPNDRLIRGFQSHCSFDGCPFKARAKLSIY